MANSTPTSPQPDSSTPLSSIQQASLEEFQRYCGFKPEEMGVLAELAEQVTFRPCETIIRQGACETCMYLLLEGEVAVSHRVNGQEVELARLRPGRFFGEVALVDDGPRSANVTALQNCTLLRLDRSTLQILAGIQPSASLHLLTAIGRSLVGLLRRNNEKVLDLLLAGKASSSASA
jgi:CRP/FNR family transcriptional regulator, cyclic AMP receptor protein